MKQLVSIIMPVYNAQEYLAETIQSVLNQSYFNWELIGVNDGSSDDSWQVLQKFAEQDSRIKILNLDDNSGGASVPRNCGLDLSNGNLIAFIDSDDLWHPEKLKVQLEEFNRLNMDFCCTGIHAFFTNDLPVKQNNELKPSHNVSPITFADLLRKNIIPLSSVLARREIFEQNLFSEDVRHNMVEDYELWLRVHANKVRSYKVRQTLVYYRVRSGSLSRSKIKMAIKVFQLLNEIEINGERLGFKVYYYYCHYIKGALLNEIR
jgi:glycosyltransferase involved in cell wall biosynthesis